METSRITGVSQEVKGIPRRGKSSCKDPESSHWTERGPESARWAEGGPSPHPEGRETPSPHAGQRETLSPHIRWRETLSSHSGRREMWVEPRHTGAEDQARTWFLLLKAMGKPGL